MTEPSLVPVSAAGFRSHIPPCGSLAGGTLLIKAAPGRTLHYMAGEGIVLREGKNPPRMIPISSVAWFDVAQ